MWGDVVTDGVWQGSPRAHAACTVEETRCSPQVCSDWFRVSQHLLQQLQPVSVSRRLLTDHVEVLLTILERQPACQSNSWFTRRERKPLLELSWNCVCLLPFDQTLTLYNIHTMRSCSLPPMKFHRVSPAIFDTRQTIIDLWAGQRGTQLWWWSCTYRLASSIQHSSPVNTNMTSHSPHQLVASAMQELCTAFHGANSLTKRFIIASDLPELLLARVIQQVVQVFTQRLHTQPGLKQENARRGDETAWPLLRQLSHFLREMLHMADEHYRLCLVHCSWSTVRGPYRIGLIG